MRGSWGFGVMQSATQAPAIVVIQLSEAGFNGHTGENPTWDKISHGNWKRVSLCVTGRAWHRGVDGTKVQEVKTLRIFLCHLFRY